MLKSRKQRYNFDAMYLSKDFVNNISKSCIQNTKTYEILAKNSDILNPSVFSISELNGFAKMEIPENRLSFHNLFESLAK